MFIYAYYDGKSYEIEMLKFETKIEALDKIKGDLKEYWVPWMEEVYEDEIDEDEMVDTIVDEIEKKGEYSGLYGEDDSFVISLKKF